MNSAQVEAMGTEEKSVDLRGVKNNRKYRKEDLNRTGYNYQTHAKLTEAELTVFDIIYM